MSTGGQCGRNLFCPFKYMVVFLYIRDKKLKVLTVIVYFPVSPSFSISLCFMFFEAVLLGS